MIALGIFIANLFQICFEVALLYSFEMLYVYFSICFKYVRKNKEAQEKEKSKDIINIASSHQEPELVEEIYYCGSQLVYMGVIFCVLALIMITIIYLEKYGRLYVILIEFFLSLAFDQVKALIAQPMVFFQMQ